ncbi:signal peptidase I [Neobacillus mesonae]|uniref:signal peptidase I n=1 Tax=Neobacillus mesonae TaxID=1193713 RepID=UPI0025740066|nr:signal peptidase I [Neobacillus mesonae]
MENTLNKKVEKENKESEVQKKNTVVGWIKYCLFLLFLVFVVHNSIGLTTISGFSMFPTFQDGDIVLEEKVSKYFNSPEMGDVAVINRPEQGYKIIKRIIGLPGDTVEIKDGLFYVNQNPIPEITTEGTPPDMDAIKVPENHIFVVGDNRTPGESIDSRDQSVGAIPKEEIDGYIIYSLKPFRSISKPLDLSLN